MNEQSKPHVPIGYWLKATDELLTEGINRAQAAGNLTRTEWQVLNLLHEVGQASRGRLAEVLTPFTTTEALSDTIDHLTQRGLVDTASAGAAELSLTEPGRGAHAEALQRQKAVRQQAMQGITEADYLTTVRVLQQIVENLKNQTKK
jgi:MarR family transcriptional regulator, organic hydroperoxide resistance regulator